MTVVRVQSPLAYVGLSSDTKPTAPPVGSTFWAYDTDVTFTFTPAGTWVEGGVGEAGQPNEQATTLRASAVTSGASQQATAVSGLRSYSVATILLDVTARTGTSPTLDVAIQRLLPDGTTWDTIARFAQVGDTTGKFVMEIFAAPGGGARATDETTTVTSSTLAAGQSRDIPWGDQLRVIHTVGGSATPTYTYAVTADFRN